MKRLLSTLLACATLLSLMTACGKSGGGSGGSGSGSGGGDAFTTDLAAFYEENTAKASEAGDFPMMMPLDDEMLESIYPGLGAIDRKQTCCNIAAISAVACEVSMVEVSNADDVQKVKDIFQARIDQQVDSGAQYPETIDAWQNDSDIIVRGNCVCLFVMPADFGDFAGAFNAL